MEPEFCAGFDEKGRFLVASLPLSSRSFCAVLAAGLCMFSALGITALREGLQWMSPAMAAEAGLPAPTGWAAFQDPKLGATLYYPSNWFKAAGAQEGAYLFTSLNDAAKLTLKSHLDEMRTGAEASVTALKEAPDAALIETIESGDNWFELRGKTSDGLARYSRVVFSCKERVVTEMTLHYPPGSAEAYAPVIAKMKRRFQSGIGTETPIRECS